MLFIYIASNLLYQIYYEMCFEWGPKRHVRRPISSWVFTTYWNLQFMTSQPLIGSFVTKSFRNHSTSRDNIQQLQAVDFHNQQSLAVLRIFFTWSTEYKTGNQFVPVFAPSFWYDPTYCTLNEHSASFGLSWFLCIMI